MLSMIHVCAMRMMLQRMLLVDRSKLVATRMLTCAEGLHTHRAQCSRNHSQPHKGQMVRSCGVHCLV
jgi:hypothetical protein